MESTSWRLSGLADWTSSSSFFSSESLRNKHPDNMTTVLFFLEAYESLQRTFDLETSQDRRAEALEGSMWAPFSALP